MTVRPFPTHIQQFDLGERIFLFQLDLTMYDLGTLYLAPGTDDNGGVLSAVSFGGQVYSPHPIKAEGFEMTTVGSLPRPTIVFSNLDNSFTALVDQNDDLQGGILTRLRTYGRYLDSGADPDGGKFAPPDVYLLSQKTKHTEEEIQWSLSALMDQEGVELPGRPIVRDYCDHPYRRWTGTGFDYTNVTCPYTGTNYFDENGDPTTAPFDKASKRLTTCCQKRFGVTGVLPTHAFPGVARLESR